MDVCASTINCLFFCTRHAGTSRGSSARGRGGRGRGRGTRVVKKKKKAAPAPVDPIWLAAKPRIIEFYESNFPDKVEKITNFLDKHKGKEKKVIEGLLKQYVVNCVR